MARRFLVPVELPGDAVSALHAVPRQQLDAQVPFSPRSFGAVGDNATDDTAALQAALTAMDVAGRGVLDLGGRTYLTGPLVMRPWLAIVNGKLQLRDGQNNWLLSLEGPSASYPRASIDWIVSDVYLDGNKANNPTSPGVLRMRAVGYRDRPLIRNVRIGNFRGVGISLDTDGLVGSQIVQPRLQHVTIDAGETAAGSVGLYVGPEVYDLSAIGIDIGRCHRGLHLNATIKHRFTDCRMWGCSDTGVRIEASRHNTFVNCEFDNNFGHGVHMVGGSEVAHFIGSAFTNSAYVDVPSAFGFGANFNLANANTRDGAFVDGCFDITFTACRFGNEDVTVGAGGEQRFGVTVAGGSVVVVSPDSTFRDHRTGTYNVISGNINSSRGARRYELGNGAALTSATDTRADLGFPSNIGAGMEFYRGTDATRPGRFAFLVGGAAGVGDAVFVHSNGAGVFTDLAAILATGGIKITDTYGAVPATPTAGGVLFVDNGVLRYRGSSGAVTALDIPSNPASVGNVLAWPYDPIGAATSLAPTTGVIYMVRIHNVLPATVTGVVLHVGTAGATVTAGFVGLYDSAGTRLAVSASQTTALQSTGSKVTPFTATLTVPKGNVFAAFVAQATTMPALRGQAAGGINTALAAQNLRSATILTGQSTLPASLTMANLAASAAVVPWLALY